MALIGRYVLAFLLMSAERTRQPQLRQGVFSWFDAVPNWQNWSVDAAGIVLVTALTLKWVICRRCVFTQPQEGAKFHRTSDNENPDQWTFDWSWQWVRDSVVCCCASLPLPKASNGKLWLTVRSSFRFSFPCFPSRLVRQLATYSKNILYINNGRNINEFRALAGVD